MKDLQIPIGIEDYKSLKSKCYYVDKTHLIKRIIDSPKSSVFLFTRPRRFGKSLALSMVETFFSLGEDNASYFSDTYIGGRGNEYMQFLNAFPVLRLNFKRADATTYGEFLKLLALDMSILCKNAINKYGLSENNRPWLSALVKEQGDESLLKTSLDRLVRALDEDCGRGPIVLIDEYDCPMDRGFRLGYYDEVQEFLKVFLGDALKGNPSLEKAIVTGVNQVSHASIFSGLNNLRVNSVFSGSGEEHFGFTDEEVEDLLAYYGCDESVGNIKSHYGGYLIQGRNLFNPWSVLSFLDSGCLYDAYWTNTGSYDLLKEAVRYLVNNTQEDLLTLCSGSSFMTTLKKNVVFNDSFTDPSVFFGLMVSSGYLTALPVQGDFYSLAIPNSEISTALKSEILSFNGENNLLPLLSKLKMSFTKGNETEIKKILTEYVLASLSYFDYSLEKAYQLIVATVLSLLFQEATVESEANVGEGRCDLLVCSRKNDFAFVIELKKRKGKKSNDELLDSAKTAIKHIKSNDYCEKVRRMGVKKVILYGMAFSGKRMEVVAETMAS